jgi:hypothetical protein
MISYNIFPSIDAERAALVQRSDPSSGDDSVGTNFTSTIQIEICIIGFFDLDQKKNKYIHSLSFTE